MRHRLRTGDRLGVMPGMPRLFVLATLAVVSCASPEPAAVAVSRAPLTTHELVKRLCPPLADGGFCDGLQSSPQFLTVGNSLVFYGNDGVHGFEPWRTDGTEAGTFMMLDLVPGPASELDQQGSTFVSMLGRAYVLAASSTDGGTQHLWEAFDDGGLVDRGAPPTAGRFSSTDAGAFFLASSGLWRVAVGADQHLTYATTAIADAGFTQLEGLETIAGRTYTVGRLPPSYDRQLLELSSTGVRSLYASSWSVFSGGEWLSLAGANDTHLFLNVASDSRPATRTVLALTPTASVVSLGTAQRDSTGATLVGPAMRRGVLFATGDGDAGLRLAIASDAPNAPTLLEPRGCLHLQLVQVLPEVAYVACFNSNSSSQLWKTDGITSTAVFTQGGGGLYESNGRPLAPEALELFANGGIGLLLTDGGMAGTRTISLGSVPARLGNRLYFASRLGQPFHPESGLELFSISVDQLLDTTPPTITCPPPITVVRPAGATSVTLTFPPVTATDDRTPSPELSVGVEQGEVYQLSSPNVSSLIFTASASDLAGNTASCQLQFTLVAQQPDAGPPPVDAGQPDAGGVTPMPRPQPSGCGCTSAGGAGWWWLLLAVLAWRRTRG